MNDLFLNNFWTSEKIREFRRKDAKVHEQESIVFGFLHSWAEKFLQRNLAMSDSKKCERVPE